MILIAKYRRFSIFIAVLCLALTAMPVFAVEEVPAQAQIDDPAIKDARSFIDNLSKDVLAVIRDKAIAEDKKKAQLEELFIQNVNTDSMGVFVLGRYNRNIEKPQRERYLKLYNKYLTLSYVPRFKEYAGESFDVVRINKEQSGEFTVQTKIVGVNNKPDIRVDYRIKQDSKNKFRVIDIIGEGVSIVTTQRSDFGGIISRNGVDYFINKLEEKVDQLSKENGA